LNFKQELGRFIGGVGRSGTTLFADMLGLHESLSPVYETDFVLPFLEWVKGRNPINLRNAMMYSMRWAEPLPYRPHNKREHERYHHGPHYVLFTKKHMEEEIKKFMDGLTTDNTLTRINRLIHELFRYHCECDNKQFWINKTPLYIVYLPELRQIFPKMKFVHCIRDGRDVACSVVTRPWGPNTYLDAAPWWKSQIVRARSYGAAHPNDYLEIRYEDFVLEPLISMERIFAFLEVTNQNRQLLKKYKEGNAGIKLSKSPIGVWKKNFTDKKKLKFWELAGDLLFDLGYTK